MSTYCLNCELLAQLPLRQVFPVFEDARNLARITPAWMSFEVKTPGRIEMRKGVEIDYTIRWLGLPMKWRTLITGYQPPHMFSDEQLKGPYVLWRHRHTFVETPEGTLVADQVEYALPMGVLGRIAHAVMVKRQLLEIFRYRQSKMPELLGAPCREIKPPTITES